jgi:hypothetical protein
MRTFFVVVLGIVLVPFVLMGVTALVVPTSTNPHANYHSDREGCMRRVGIRREPPDYYTASKA